MEEEQIIDYYLNHGLDKLPAYNHKFGNLSEYLKKQQVITGPDRFFKCVAIYQLCVKDSGPFTNFADYYAEQIKTYFADVDPRIKQKEKELNDIENIHFLRQKALLENTKLFNEVINAQNCQKIAGKERRALTPLYQGYNFQIIILNMIPETWIEPFTNNIPSYVQRNSLTENEKEEYQNLYRSVSNDEYWSLTCQFGDVYFLLQKPTKFSFVKKGKMVQPLRMKEFDYYAKPLFRIMTKRAAFILDRVFSTMNMAKCFHLFVDCPFLQKVCKELIRHFAFVEHIRETSKQQTRYTMNPNQEKFELFTARYKSTIDKYELMDTKKYDCPYTGCVWVVSDDYHKRCVAADADFLPIDAMMKDADVMPKAKKIPKKYLYH